jgi:hypothetical protein
MREFVKSYWPVCVIVVLAMITVLWFATSEREGIVAIDGWGHGVALCQGQDAPDQEMVTQPPSWFNRTFGTEGGFHTWQTDGVYYLVNYGHMGDGQVSELVSLAKQHCGQY